MDSETYRKSWFEVAIHHPVLDREEESQLLSVPQTNSMNGDDSPFHNGTLPYYMHYGDMNDNGET